ncbi:hypothetical protein CJ030_MR6G017560 [Morella rubra]|uniref:Uncharacterized protein n=1 Tax=Morella rubra TaxID=262757 RepID=A0A6A1VEY0_9ROSI|nr:hypothetical protein CJ030_MR6G017560 [Morella rubra]
MAALSVGHSLYRKHSKIQGPRKSSSPKALILLCCRNDKPTDASKPRTTKESKGESPPLQRISVGFEKFGKVLKENLSPQRKGDWKDVMLMSLSFAVYVYISQRIVCAYCAWTFVPKQPW